MDTCDPCSEGRGGKYGPGGRSGTIQDPSSLTQTQMRDGLPI